MPTELSFPALGTTATLLVSNDDAFDVALGVLQAEIDAIDRACSRFRDDSEISAVNASAGRATCVSELFTEALDVALRAARATGGAVDPTVGSALRVLGYNRSFDEIDLDGPPLEVSVRRIPGWQTIEVDRARSSVRVPTGVQLDFGATAKALCADRAAAAVLVATGASVLVSLGGDVSVNGAPPGGGWPIVIADDHAASDNGAGPEIRIRSGGLASSGTSVRRWHRGGREFHHIVDPSTGRPADEHWRTASVCAATCVDANIASTAAIIMGTHAPAWLEARGLPARLVAPDGRVTCVAGWPQEARAAC